MRSYGLIGYPLGHSFSKKYFEEKFRLDGITDAVYELFPLKTVEKLPALIRENPGLCGLNVTIPYKKEVISYLDDMDPVAEQLGAVNCIKIKEEAGHKRLTGYNTDIYGFTQSLQSLLDDQKRSALIFGSGGAAKAISYALDNLQINHRIVSRSPDRGNLTYQDLTFEMIRHTLLLINATSLGMFPEVSSCPEIPYEAITSQHILFDLVYNPEITVFLKNGASRGAVVKNGMEMLAFQAEQSWEIWNNPEF